jgi:predicted DNA-binding transcriptional regulator AlpA
MRESDVESFLGPNYRGRRFLRVNELIAIGVVCNRQTLSDWVKHGLFPAGIRIAGPRGRTLVWSAIEVAEHLAQRAAERQEQHLNCGPGETAEKKRRREPAQERENARDIFHESARRASR